MPKPTSILADMVVTETLGVASLATAFVFLAAGAAVLCLTAGLAVFFAEVRALVLVVLVVFLIM